MPDDKAATISSPNAMDGVCVDMLEERTTEDETLSAKHRRQRRNNKANATTSISNSSTMKNIHSETELTKLISNNEAVVVEFMTSWCGACKGIAPLYQELADASTGINDAGVIACAQVLCDTKNKETKKLAAAHGVSSYPVFVLYQDGVSVGRWNGADRGKLEKAFERLISGDGGKKKGGRRRGR